MQKTVSILVKGKVQGVFYRQSTKEKATALGLTGIVKNQEDGSVYIEASGTAEQIEKLIAWCKQGPPRAQVTSVEEQELPVRQFSGFNVQR